MTDPNPNPNPAPEPPEPPAPPAPPEPDRTFTQADVDRIVKDRLARAKSDPPPDYEDLKQKAAKLAEIEEANATELEKAQKRAEEAEAARAQMEQEAKEVRLRAALLSEIGKADRKVIDPDAALMLVDKAGLELDDSGNVTNAAQAVDSLLEARPYLVAAGGARPNGADQGARTGGATQLSREALQDMSPEDIRAALKEGKLNAVLGG